jgi:hypothetical protein
MLFPQITHPLLNKSQLKFKLKIEHQKLNFPRNPFAQFTSKQELKYKIFTYITIMAR